MFGSLIAELIATNISDSVTESLVQTAVICCGFREPKCNRTLGCFACLQAQERPQECRQWQCLINVSTNGGWPPGESSCTEEPAYIIPIIIVVMFLLKLAIFICCFTDRQRALESAWAYMLSWRDYCGRVKQRKKSDLIVDASLVTVVNAEELDLTTTNVATNKPVMPSLNSGVTVEVIPVLNCCNSPMRELRSINRDLTISGRSDLLSPNSPSETEPSLTTRRSLMSLQLLCRNHMDPSVLDNQDYQFITDSLSLTGSSRSYDCTSMASGR